MPIFHLMTRIVKRLKFFIFVAFALLLIKQEAYAISYQAVADSLMGQLKFQKTADDSLKMLYDIFDASDHKYKLAPGKMVLDLAKRTGNQLALIDFIPQVASLVTKDSVLMNDMLEYTKAIKDPEHAKTVRLFIYVKKAAMEANYYPDKYEKETLLKYARQSDIPDPDVYDEILDLYRMVIFLGNRNRGNLYLEYLTRLEELISEIPSDFAYLLNLYYTTAANCHTRNGNYEKAIEMDRKILEIISNLEERYKKMGRKYRDYHRYYYISYRRMLCNYPGLSLDEVRDLYNKCEDLAKKDDEIARDFSREERPAIFRYMAEGNYKEVVPRINKALPMISDNAIRRKLLGMLVEAADSINDQATLLYALKDHNKMLQQRVDEQSVEAYRELQIRYDVNKLKNDKERLSREKKQVEVATGQRVIAVALAAVLIMAVVLMFLYRSNFSLKRKIRDTQEENASLRKTIDELLGESATLHGTLNVRQDGRGSNTKDSK